MGINLMRIYFIERESETRKKKHEGESYVFFFYAKKGKVWSSQCRGGPIQKILCANEENEKKANVLKLKSF